MSLTSTRSSRSNRLTSEDLPTFGPADDRDAHLARACGRPGASADARTGRRARGSLRRRRTCRRRQPRDDLVEQVADALAVLGRDLDHGLEAKLVELHRAVARPPVVHLVDRQDDRHPERRSSLRDLVVAGRRPFAAVHDEDDQVGALDARAARRRRPARAADPRWRRTCPPVSISSNPTPCHTTGCAMTSRVVPGIGVTMARREAVIRLNSVDLPTFGRPTSTTAGGWRSPHGLASIPRQTRLLASRRRRAASLTV